MNYVIVVLVIILLQIIYLSGEIFITAIARSNKENTYNDSSIKDKEHEWFREHGKEIVQVSDDNIKLVGYEFLHKEKKNTWVISIHGHGMNAITGCKPQKFFYYGWNVLCPDLRAHGKSEGNYVGMGWLDRKDILTWVNYIISQNPDANIILYGWSMGASTVMMTSGEKLPQQVKCGIADCGYSSVYDIIAIILRKKVKISGVISMHIASLLTKILAGYDFREASCIGQLSKGNLPILFIHGTEDEIVPFDMLDKVYEAARGEKEKQIFEGAKHMQACQKEPERYWKCAYEFIDKHIEEERIK